MARRVYVLRRIKAAAGRLHSGQPHDCALLQRELRHWEAEQRKRLLVAGCLGGREGESRTFVAS